MQDQIGSSHMTQGNLTSFTMDRFGCPNSALALNGGWTQVPSGLYLNTPEFTISVWMLPQQVDIYARLIDFGDGPNLNNIFVSFSTAINTVPPTILFQPAFRIYWQTYYTQITSNQALKLNEWQFFAITFNQTIIRIYLNGTLAIEASHNIILPFSLTRKSCYIGKSNWPGDGHSYSFLDDLRFYNKSLNQAEIVDLMNQIGTSN